jgi:Asp-tRNA(Asn)/Glu-tRNA(Gln) amidotransferase B subunit
MDAVNSARVIKETYKPSEIPEHLIAEYIKESNAGNKNFTKLLEKLASGGEPKEKISPEGLRLLGRFFAADTTTTLSNKVAKKLLQLAQKNGSEKAQQDIDDLGLNDCDSSLEYDETPF